MVLALTLLFLAPLQPAGEPSLEQLLEKHAELHKATIDAQNAEAASLAAIKARYKDITDKINRLLPNPGPDIKPPVDVLAGKLREAFGTGNPNDAKALAALYREAAKLCEDAALESGNQLNAKLAQASTAMVGKDVLIPLRKVVLGELQLILGANPTDEPLTDVQRKAAAALFVRLATILEGF